MSTFGRPLVLFGPSGTGKSTLLRRLFAAYPDKFGFSISHTTRLPRPGETDGKEYYFVTREQFLALVDQGAFIEHAQFSSNLYGTTVKAVGDVSKQGRRCILDIDAQGVRLIKQHHPDLKPVFVFISPPSLSELRKRLVGRGTETDDAVKARLQTALNEISYVKDDPKAVDVVVVNDDLDKAYNLLETIALGNEANGDALPELSD